MAYFIMADEGETPLGVPYFVMYKDPAIFEEKTEIASSRGYTRVRRLDVIRLLSPVRSLPAVRDPEPVRQL